MLVALLLPFITQAATLSELKDQLLSIASQISQLQAASQTGSTGTVSGGSTGGLTTYAQSTYSSSTALPTSGTDPVGTTVTGNCTFNGQTIVNGQSIYAFEKATMPAGIMCTREQRTCQNGVLTGRFPHLACTISNPVSLNGYVFSQKIPTAYTIDALKTILEEKGTAVPVLQKSHFTIEGKTADTFKIVQSGVEGYRYLGVYHSFAGGVFFDSYLAYSNDLINWKNIGRISQASGMPDVRILPDRSVLLAHERNPSGNRPYIEVWYYNTFNDFISKPGSPSRVFALPQTAQATADGTPEFGHIVYSGNILSSTIEITYHYFANSIADKQAKGTLTNFSQWSGGPDTATNNLFASLGFTHLGGREFFTVGGTLYELIEVNPAEPTTSNGWHLWEIFLINKATGDRRQLQINIPGGATSLGNPQLSYITTPDHRPALAISYFVFSEGSASTPAGPHVYIYPLGPAAPQCSATFNDTRTFACPSGQVGLITEMRTPSCPSGASSPVWTGWQNYSNTCVPQSITYEAEQNSHHSTGSLGQGGWQVLTGTHKAGHMQYGPYAKNWGDGKLTATFRFKKLGTAPQSGNVLNIDLYDSTTGTIVAQQYVDAMKFNTGNNTIDITLPAEMAGRAGHTMEARVWWYGNTSLLLDYVRINQISTDYLPASNTAAANAAYQGLVDFVQQLFRYLTGNTQ